MTRGNGQPLRPVAAWPEPVVTGTWLSRAPHPASSVVSALSVLALFIGSHLERRTALGPFMGATRAAIWDRGEAWRCLTSVFVHADMGHLLANALPLGVLSYLAFGYFGIVVHPLASLLGGALVMAVGVLAQPPTVRLVGASGVVYLLAGFWLTMYLLLERRHPVGRRAVRAAGFALVLLVPGSIDPAVSHGSHALGFALGVALAAAVFRARRRKLRGAETWDLPDA